MKCCKCRAEMPEGVKFCPKCGAEQGFDKDLIKRAVDGEQEAITELYNRTYNNAYYTVKALISDEDTVLDLLQDSYLKAFKNLNQLQEPDKFRAWIKRIAHNHAVDYLRKTKPVMFSTMSTDDESVVEFEDDRVENLPEELLDRKETSRLIEEILSSLTDEQRLAISMFYYEQLSVREIAETLGVSENTVKSRLNYARKNAQEKIKKLEKEQGIRLHSLAPIPFLLWLFKSQDVQAAEIPRLEPLFAVQEECVKYSSKAAPTAPETSPEAPETGTEQPLGAGTEEASKAVKIGSKAAKTTAKAAGKGVATKVIAGVVAVAVLGGGGIAAYKAMNNNNNQPDSQPVEGVEIVGFPHMGFEHYALVDEEMLRLTVTCEREDDEIVMGYILGSTSDEITVWDENYEMDGNYLKVKNAEIESVGEKMIFTGDGLNGEKLENVEFYINGSEEADRLISEYEQMYEYEEDIELSAYDFDGYYRSQETSIVIDISSRSETTARIYLDNTSSNGANAFNYEGEAYFDGESLVLDMETSEGDTITFTLDDTSLIVHASEHYQARTNTYISGTYYLSSYQENEESVNLDDYVGEYMNGQDWNAGTLSIEKRDEKYLNVKLQGFRNRGDQELSTVFEIVAEPENITNEGITINVYGEDVTLIKTDIGFKLNVPESVRNQLGFDSYLYDNEYFSTAPY